MHPSASSSKKGQLEIVVVLGILIVAVVAATLLIQHTSMPQPGTTPPGIQQEYRDVEEYVTGVMRDGAQVILKQLRTHGGFLNPSDTLGENLVTEFLFQDVPVWQACELKFYRDLPEVENEFEQALTFYLQDPEHLSIQAIGDKQVVFDAAQANVAVTIHDNTVNLALTVPTTVDGISIQGPYVTSVDTSFGRIYAFADDFAIEARKEPYEGGRFFETFLEQSLRGNKDVRDKGILTLCYSPVVGCIEDNPNTDLVEPSSCIDYSANDIETAVHRAVFGAIHFELWKEMQDQSAGAGAREVKAKRLFRVNGKQYPDLDIRFDLPDNFFEQYVQTAGYEGIYSENPIFSGTTTFCPPFCTPGICGPVYYNNAFDVLPFPVIVGVRDSNGDYFNFAVIVDLDAGSSEASADPNIILELLLGDSQVGFDELVDEYGLGSQLDESFGVRLLGGDGGPLIPEEEGFISNAELPEEFALEFFEEADAVCWYDADSDEDFTTPDVFWKDSQGDCTTGLNVDAGDVVLIASTPTASTGIVVTTEATGLKYNETVTQNGMYDPGEEIYYDFRDGIAAAFNGMGFSGTPETLTAITEGMVNVIDMFPGDCVGS